MADADVDMPDAAGPSKAVVKSKGGDGDGKKRFEVKKWSAVALWAWDIVVGPYITSHHITYTSPLPARPAGLKPSIC
ncbi:hypothetical protein H072_7213 [Dactylellina haptotyla CBS 200.50]|uniref:Uncharacterized protein n=1 Tax=Dactylellina haptotyla (strain CBS 200.50) TaxID=1284197 RepID=S8A844_DACHA|nr:hypothetical protein H072_7213 [Dactylellina haptotyla CBS 200.50]